MNLFSGVHYDLVWCKVAILENDGSEVDSGVPKFVVICQNDTCT